MKWLVHSLFIVIYLGVAFFGLGPVLLADGVIGERVFFAVVVIVLYSIIIIFHWKINKWMKK